VADTEILTRGCRAFGISVTDRQTEQFLAYYDLLIEWNKVMNLTAITEFEEVMSKHFVDSCALGKAVALDGKKRLLDVGTGAGFPGIPLKIIYPELEVVLLDSLNKRVKFLNEVIERLGLTGITAIHGRAEDIAKQKEYRGSFDLVVSRAVANLSSLSEYCLPFVKTGGLFVPYKSGNVDLELSEAEKAIKVLGGEYRDTVRFTLSVSGAFFCVFGDASACREAFASVVRSRDSAPSYMRTVAAVTAEIRISRFARFIDTLAFLNGRIRCCLMPSYNKWCEK